MTKSVRHKKIRQTEIKKLKMKIGKKLKKARNETKTEFKTRKITLQEQLAQKGADVTVTKKQLSIKDLIARVGHPSTYVRRDGLNGFQELVTTCSKETLAIDMSSIVQYVVPSILDVDQLIRKTAIKIIDFLLTKMGTQMGPYLGIVSSYLSCAMVHLNMDVQTDSLYLMGSLVKHVPSVIAKSANTLLENFLFLIAQRINKDRANASTKGFGSSSSYHLISDPHSTHSTSKWRVQMLKSLSNYLDAILSGKGKIVSKSAQPISMRETIVTGCLPPLLNSSLSNIHEINLKIFTDDEKTEKFITSLVSILFEVWAEFDNGLVYSVQGNPLSSMALQVLLCISQIILHVWKMVDIALKVDPVLCSWFMKCLKQQFSKRIIPGFPYSAHSITVENADDNPDSNPSKKTLSENNIIEKNCQKLNINIAAIAMLLTKEDESLRTNVVEYYVSVLHLEKPSACIVDIINTCCLLLPLCSDSLGNDILHASLDAFQRNKRNKKSIMQIILKATDWDCQHLWTSDEVKKWMKYLLVESTDATNNDTESILFALVQFKLRNVPGYKEILRDNSNLLNTAQTRHC